MNSMELELQLRKDHARLSNGLVLQSLQGATQAVDSADDVMQLINDSWPWLQASLDQSGASEWLPVEVEHQDAFLSLVASVASSSFSNASIASSPSSHSLLATAPSLLQQARGLSASTAAWGQDVPRMARLKQRLQELLQLQEQLRVLTVMPALGAAADWC